MSYPTHQFSPKSITMCVAGRMLGGRSDGAGMPVAWTYDPADPWAVHLQFGDGGLWWVFARSWVVCAVAGAQPGWYQRLNRCAQQATDMYLARDPLDPDVLLLDLSVRHQDHIHAARVGMPVDPVRRWLAESQRLVPSNTEHTRIDWAGELAAMFPAGEVAG